MKHSYDPAKLFLLIFGVFTFGAATGLPFPIWIIAILFLAQMARTDKRKNPRDPRRRDQDRPDYRRRTDRGGYERDYQRRGRERGSREKDRAEMDRRRTEQQKRSEQQRRIAKSEPFKNSGIKKFKDYDYDGAIVDFVKALEINHKDIATHFNIACAYSLTEDKDKAFYHLSEAVKNGFNDVEKIKTHDALAFLRIQDEFDDFAENGYQLTENKQEVPPTITPDDPPITGDLLEQLKQLGELRDRGLLTQEEFLLQKEKLLRR